MTGKPDRIQRQVLPIPDRPNTGLITYDAKDPDTSYPADRAAAAAAGRPERPDRPARRRRLRLVERLRRALRHADRRGPRRGWPQVQPLPHDRALRADPAGAADRAQSSLGRDGRDHRGRDLGAGLQLDPTQHGGAARRNPEVERLLDRAVRQVSRGAGLAGEPDGPVRRLAQRRRWLRALLRLHRRRDQPVQPGAVRGDDRGRAGPDGGGGLPPHRGPGRPGDRLDPPTEGADAGQAVLHLLRSWRDPCSPPRPGGVVGQVQRQVRPGLGRAARGNLRPAEEAGSHPRRRRADRPPRRDPRLGGHAGGAAAGAGPADGDLRRVHGAHRPPRRPGDQGARGSRDPRRHARLLHRRRQRRLRRGDAARKLQRVPDLQRCRRAGNP